MKEPGRGDVQLSQPTDVALHQTLTALAAQSNASRRKVEAYFASRSDPPPPRSFEPDPPKLHNLLLRTGTPVAGVRARHDELVNEAEQLLQSLREQGVAQTLPNDTQLSRDELLVAKLTAGKQEQLPTEVEDTRRELLRFAEVSQEQRNHDEAAREASEARLAAVEARLAAATEQRE